MAHLKLYIVVLTLLVVGCASVTEMKKKDKFEQITAAYELAIRWSDFDMASSFSVSYTHLTLPTTPYV